MRVLYVLMFLMTIAGALGDLGGVRNVDFFENNTRIEELVSNTSDTYIVGWVTTREVPIRPIKGTKAGVRIVNGVGVYTNEADPYIKQLMTIINRTSFAFMVQEQGLKRYPYRDVPVTFCVNGTRIVNGKRYLVRGSPYCNSDLVYVYPRLKFNSRLYITTQSFPKNLEWWFGGDTLTGITPQGGGLPVCSGISAVISVNQTKTWVNSTFTHKIRLNYIDYEAGCTATWLEAQNYNDVPAWRVHSTSNVSNTNVQCMSSSCVENPISFGVWYTKDVKCKWEGNRTLRTRGKGTVSTVNKFSNSNSVNMECLSVPVIEDDGVGAWWIFAFPFMMMITTLLVRKKQRDKQKYS